MHFIMHHSGIYYYNPEDEGFFFNTVVDNKEIYSKRHIKADEQARELCASIGYPPVKYYRWVIQIN